MKEPDPKDTTFRKRGSTVRWQLQMVLSCIALTVSCGSETTIRPPATAKPTPSAVATSRESTPAPASAPVLPRPQNAAPSDEQACFETPVEIIKYGFGPKPMDAAAKARLERCPSTSPRVECEYAKARVYFDHNRFELAAPIFREIALTPGVGERGLYAARLMLECVNILASSAIPPRRSCLALMRSDVQTLLSLYCQKEVEEHKEFCRVLGGVNVDLQRLAAEELVRQADQGASDAEALYREGGERYMSLFEELCTAGRPTGHDGFAARCDELVYNALMAFRAGGAKDRAAAARAALLDPRNGLDGSELAERVAAEDL